MSLKHFSDVPQVWTSLFAVGAIVAVLAGGPAPAAGQDGTVELIERFRTARFEVTLEDVMANVREEMRARPLRHLPTAADTLRPWLAQRWTPDVEIEEEEPEEVFEVTSWSVISRFERGWFERVYGDTRWAYLGRASSYDNPAPVDTTLTQHLRAYLETEFGRPTYTLVERGEDNPEEEAGALQFEYWFVLNENIPMKIIDPNGPLDRGLVLVIDNRYRDELPTIRAEFLEKIMDNAEPSAYVDYYYDTESNRWYRVGYDGNRYFQTAIRPPNLDRGRPRLE